MRTAVGGDFLQVICGFNSLIHQSVPSKRCRDETRQQNRSQGNTSKRVDIRSDTERLPSEQRLLRAAAGGTGEGTGEPPEPRIRNSTDQLDPQKAFCFLFWRSRQEHERVLIFFKFDPVSEDETKFILKVETSRTGGAATARPAGARNLLLLYSVGRTHSDTNICIYTASGPNVVNNNDQ